MRALAGVLVLLPTVLILGCPQSVGPVVPTPDADAQPGPPHAFDAPPGSSACQAACAALAAVGCAEGSSPACSLTLTHIDADRLVRTASGAPLTCAALAQVTTAPAARALGITCVDAP